MPRSQEPKEKDPQTLIPLEGPRSDATKRFFSMGWRHAQFAILNEQHTHYLPRELTNSSSGLNMRLKIMGEPVYRKIILEITHRSSPDSKPCTAYLYLDNLRHVSDYNVLDRVHRKGRQGKAPKTQDSEMKEKSFWILNMEVSGVIAIGLDADQNDFDLDTRNLFSFLQHVAQTANPNEKYPLTICVNAHYGIDEENDQKGSTGWARFKAVQDVIYDFKKNVCTAWNAYCSVRGKPLTQWGMFAEREMLSKMAVKSLKAKSTDSQDQPDFGSGIIKYPPQVSFSDLDEAAIALCYGAFIEWRREKEIYDDISSEIHHVGFIRFAERGIIAAISYTIPDTLTKELFKVKEGSTAKITFRLPALSLGRL